MSIKSLLFIICIGGAAVGYTWYPKDDPLTQYQYRPVAVPEAEVMLFRGFMETLQKYCQDHDFQRIEKIFLHSQATREIAKAECGVDPVVASLETLRAYHGKIKWRDCRVITYHQAPDSYEVTAGGETSKDSLRFRFRRLNQNYYLEAIEIL